MARVQAVGTQPDDRKVRERLHSAAAQLFARKGYASATVREIVDRAGVTKPVLYYYYGSKEGIYKAIVEDAMRDFDLRAGRVETLKGRASLRLRRLCGEIFDLSLKHLDVVRLMHSFYYGPPQGAPFYDFDSALFRFHDMVGAIVRQGVRAGEFRGNAEAMTLAVLGACNECIDLALVRPERGVDRAGFEKVLDVVLQGMKKRNDR